MFILMWAGGMPFNGKTIPSGKSLGGSETAAYYMAKELAALGHDVVLFTASQESGKWDGVTYEWHGQQSEQHPLGERFHFCAQVPFDVAIIQRHPLAFSFPINAKIKIMWNHDIAQVRNGEMVHRSLPFMDFIFAVSNWHREQIMKAFDLDKEAVLATSNGVDHVMIDAIPQQVRLPRSLLYTARPERGLENLVKPGGIMEKLPDCHLYVCGYDNTMPNMAGYYNWLWQRCKELPNVTNLGPLGKEELYTWENKVMLHVYPTTFEDTSCIAAMESQAAGTPFITSQQAALPETCRNAGAVLLPLLVQTNGQGGSRIQVNEKLFAKTITRILGSESEWNTLHEKALTYKRPWSDVAKQWVNIIEQRFAENTDLTTVAGRTRMAKHLERMSDIIALDKIANVSGEAFKILKTNYGFYLNNTFADHYKRYYQYEKDRGVNYGPEDLQGNNRFEAICSLVAKEMKKPVDNGMTQVEPFRILDYGCAHGHYVMNLKNRFPGIEIVGVDIEASNIETAKKWAADSGDEADGVSFYQGTIDEMPEGIGTFDIVMANEVLEHVTDPVDLAEKLKAYIKPGATFIASVPYGPWEAIGYDAHPGWRAHLHHFERQDLLEIFGEQPGFGNVAVPTGHELGSYIVAYQTGGPALGRIDYERKLKHMAPRQTVSVCMILKNEEYNLARCLAKLRPIADEIIVGIDATTTDRTKDVAKSFGCKTMDIPPCTEIGFDAARNLTIGEAQMDWILWIDADEMMENTEALTRYLQNTPVDGLAIAQHHLGVNPPGCQKTDYPCRLFRNGQGVRFFGMVHEHPEKALNEGIGKIAVTNETSIGHYGYSTEQIRRSRFERNFPLMEKDRKKYPKRKLGTMLWVRDLAHVVRYERERYGRLTERGQRAALEGIHTWRTMLAEPKEERNMRMIAESLGFYSECVHALGGGGVEMAMNIGASPFGGVKLSDKPLVGLFANTADASRFAQILTQEVLEPINEKYL